MVIRRSQLHLQHSVIVPSIFCYTVVVATCVLPLSSLVAQEAFSFLDQYCVDCHSVDGAESGIALDAYQTQADLLNSGKELLRVLDAVEEGLMPPADADQPTQQDRERFTQWVQDNLLASDHCIDSESTAVVIRRLNRQEYNNTLHDLLGIVQDFSRDFPPDDIGFGYDNIGSVLNISPIHIERYLAAAERAMQLAIVPPDVHSMPPVELIGLRTYPLPYDGLVEFEHHLAPGRYRADFSLVRAGVSESVTPPTVEVGFGTDRRSVDAATVQDETVVYQFWITVNKEDNQVSVKLANPNETRSDEKGDNISGDQRYGSNRGLHVDSLVVRGPYEASQPIPSSHTAIVIECPGNVDQERIGCGQKIVERFARLAFRRPVANHEVDRLMQIFRQANRRGESFERAVQVTLTAVLVSPQFLYLIEPKSGEQDRELTEHELASRLSYFLWSSMPDAELMRAADQGQLRGQLRSQLARMLLDEKSQSFIENFVGQWLHLRNLAEVSPDSEAFPEFNRSLAEAMRGETEQFFAFVLRENRSALELLDADYTFLNQELASHYSIGDVQGSRFRRVELQDLNRGGILTHASILTLTSHHNRTSPVKRGQWILQQILGTPPPPPPPDVAALDESPGAAKSGSLRERLELHRTSPECASCHQQMDPLGFGLENFDAIGRWREQDGDFEIDPTGTLPGERSFNNVRELKEVLKSTASRRFSWCLIENMLTYALGRSLESQDYCTVESIRRRLASNEYRIQEILYAIVESHAFQHRGVSH